MSFPMCFEGKNKRWKLPATLIELKQKISEWIKIQQFSIYYLNLEKKIIIESQEQYQEFIQINNTKLILQIEKIQQNQEKIQENQEIILRFKNEEKIIQQTTQFDQLIEVIRLQFNTIKKDQFKLQYRDQNNLIIDIENQDDFESYLEDKLNPIQIDEINQIKQVEQIKTQEYNPSISIGNDNNINMQGQSNGWQIPNVFNFLKRGNNNNDVQLEWNNDRVELKQVKNFKDLQKKIEEKFNNIYQYKIFIDRQTEIKNDQDLQQYFQSKKRNTLFIIQQINVSYEDKEYKINKPQSYEELIKLLTEIFKIKGQKINLKFNNDQSIHNDEEYQNYLKYNQQNVIHVFFYHDQIHNIQQIDRFKQLKDKEEKEEKKREREIIRQNQLRLIEEKEKEIERSKQMVIERQKQEIEKQKEKQIEKEIERQNQQREIKTQVIIQEQILQLLQKQINPQCSEHLINNMIYDCHKSIYPKIQDLNQLQKMINDDEKIDSKNIDQLFESLKTSLKNKQQPKLISNLQEMLRKTRPLNIEELSQLINRAEEAANQVKDQDIILLMGQTGTGKSTTVYFLAGQKLQLEPINIGKDKTINNFAPIGQIINKDLEKINISCKGESETKYITPVNIEINKFHTAFICDSPGFGDTAGAEVDIANSIGIIQAIKMCKSVRPVILVSQLMVGDRGDGLKKLTELIASMFKGNIKDQLRSFTYLYSKFSNETDINSFLENIYNSIKKEVKNDDQSPFKFIFEDMILKSQEQQEIHKINPLQDQDRETILQNIWDKKPIEYPGDIFQYIMTENSRSKLLEQINLHEKCIQKGLQNFQFDLVNHKMNQLKLLNDKLKLGQLEILYKQQVHQISKFITDKFNREIEEFNKMVENQINLQRNDIQKYQNFMKKIQSAQILRQHYDIQQAEILSQNIDQQCDILQKRLEHKIYNFDSKFMTDFDNLQLINQEFNEVKIKNLYDKVFEQFNNHFKFQMQRSVISINQKKYKEVAETLNFIQQFIKVFDKKIDLQWINQVYSKIIEQINDQITKFNGQCESIVQQKQFKPQELNILIEYQKILQDLSETYQIHHHITKESIQNASSKFYNYFLNYFEEIQNQINETFIQDKKNISNNQDLFQSIQLQLKKMEDLRKQIANLEYKSEKIYNNCLQIIANYVRDVHTQSINFIVQLKEDPKNFDCIQFDNILIKLDKSKWIDDHQYGFYSDIINQLEMKIIQQLQKWQDELDELPFDLNNSQNIQAAYKIKQYSEKFSQFQVKFTRLVKFIQNISDQFNQELKMCLNSIEQQQFKPNIPNIFDPATAEKSLVFFDICKQKKIITEDIRKVQNDFVKSLKIFEDTSSCEKLLDQILKAGNQEQMKKSSDNVQKIYESLNIIYAMNNYKFLQESIKADKIIERFQTKLNKIYHDLRKILQESDVTQIKEYLNLTLNLSDLDKFIFVNNQKFHSLYQEFNNLNNEEFKENYNKLLLIIKEQRYELFSYELNNIGVINERFKNRIKYLLQSQINEQCQQLIFKIYTMNKDLKKEDLAEIVSKIDNLKQAHRLIPKKYLEDQVSQLLDSNIKQCQDQIKQKIKDRIELIKSYSINNSFKEANHLRVQLNESVLLLMSCIQANDINEQIKGLEDEIDKQIQKQCQDQGQVKINEYCYKPPKQLLMKLYEVMNMKTLYALEYQKLEEIIRNDIQDEINQIKEANYDQKVQKLQELKSATKFLPQTLKQEIEKNINSLDNNIKNINSNFDKEFKDLKDKDDFKKQLQFIQRCKDSKNDEYQKKMEDVVNTKVNQIKESVLQFIHDKDYEKALKNYQSLLNYYKKFGENKYIEIVNQTKQILQQKFENIISQLLEQIQQKTQYQDIIQEQYEYYQQFIKWNSNINGIDIDIADANITLFKSQNEDKLENLFKQKIQNLHQSYESSKQNFDMIRLEESLKQMKKWQNLMTNISKSLNMPNLSKYIDSFKKNYNDMQKEVTLILQANLQEINNQDFNLNQQDKQLENHYTKLQNKIKFNELAIRIHEHILNEYNVKSDELDIRRKLLNKIKDVVKSTIKIIDQEDIEINFLKVVRINLQNLIIFEKISQEKENEIIINVNNGVEQIKEKITLKVQKCIDICINDKLNYKVVVVNLIKIAKIIQEIPSVSTEIKTKMQLVLKRLKSECNTFEFSQIYQSLEQDNQYGKYIIQDHECFFKGFQFQLFKSNTANHNIDYVLKKIEGDSIDHSQLKKFYDRYQQKYQALVNQYIIQQNNQADKDDSIIKELANKVKQIPSKKINQKDIIWNVKDEILQIMAYIFTIQTFSNIQYYNEMKQLKQKQEEREQFLWQPHPGQIIAIFRILGIGYEDGFFKTLFGFNESRLVNNLIQIGTGEGKSVTLAVTSCILALYDIDVYCACYSEYLSQRDYSSFSKLFEQLGLTEKIHYGTFNKLCESVINDKFDIRQKVTNTVNQSGISQEQIKNNNRPKILLIDEVDVFFSEEFYGNIYAPLAKIKHSKIKELTDFLWSNREKKLNMKQIEQTQQFIELCKQFKGWESLIKEIVKSMKQDLQCFKHDYIVQNQKIGYKEQDQIVFNVIYGYKTMWAYYHEFQNNNVSKQDFLDNISIQIKCGTFSFAEIPKSFMNILGVTGTLKDMGKAQKKIISEDYNIKIQSYMPSIFGKNQCEFNEKASVKYWDKDDYFKEIKVEIKNNIGDKPNQRACLVFFETKEKLMEFYEYYSLEEQNIQYLTEETSTQEQSSIINKSTNPGSVTLITKLFGRGIDFIVRDQKIQSNRGLHVLQTFLSEEVSEELQIKGRTARQGQKGTYSMVLLDQDLEKYIGPNYLQDLKDMQDNNNLYSRLNEKRNLYLENKQKSISDMIQLIKKDHNDAENFKQSLLEKKIQMIQNFLLSQNKGEPDQIQSRTLCLMDATGSMSNLLQKTKNTVGQMFQRAVDILKQYNLPEDCFQLQFVVYRDYDCMEGILQYSTWESKPDQLRNFMDKISAKGGGGNHAEAIEIGLLHCNRENQNNSIDQIILIGDEPAKKQLDIDRDRKKYGGEDYWITNGFPNTHYLKEIEKLQQHKIPIHSFYLYQWAKLKSNFEEISNLTGGKSGFLQIGNDSGSEQLTALVTETILLSLPQGNQLVEAYRAKFGKAFA